MTWGSVIQPPAYPTVVDESDHAGKDLIGNGSEGRLLGEEPEQKTVWNLFRKIISFLIYIFYNCKVSFVYFDYLKRKVV